MKRLIWKETRDCLPVSKPPKIYTSKYVGKAHPSFGSTTSALAGQFAREYKIDEYLGLMSDSIFLVNVQRDV